MHYDHVTYDHVTKRVVVMCRWWRAPDNEVAILWSVNTRTTGDMNKVLTGTKEQEVT